MFVNRNRILDDYYQAADSLTHQWVSLRTAGGHESKVLDQCGRKK